MLIFGTKHKRQRVGGGQFFCPACRLNIGYSLARKKQFFHVFFVALLPTGDFANGEWYVCDDCGTEYDEQVFQIRRRHIEASLQPWTCPSCGRLNPGDYIRCPVCKTGGGDPWNIGANSAANCADSAPNAQDD